MASNVVKTERYSEIDDNDPLADLSRIMGLDTQSRSTSSDDLDFGIDLERELLGEAEAQGAPLAGAYDEQADAEFDAAFSEFATDLVVEPPQAQVDGDLEFDNLDLLSDEMNIALADASPKIAPEPVVQSYVVPEPTASAVVDQSGSDFSLEGELDDLLREPEVEGLYSDEAANIDILGDVSDDAAGDDWAMDDAAIAGDILHDGKSDEPAVAVQSFEVTPISVAQTELEDVLFSDEPVQAANDSYLHDASGDVSLDFEAADFELSEFDGVETARVEVPVEAAFAPVAVDTTPASLEMEFESDQAFEDLSLEIDGLSYEATPEPVAAAAAFEVTQQSGFDAPMAEIQDSATWDVPLADLSFEELDLTDEPAATHQEIPTLVKPEVRVADVAPQLYVAPSEHQAVPAAAVQSHSRFQPLFKETETPAVSADDADPFAMLADLASAPPILKALNRTNPVVTNPTGERPVHSTPTERPLNSWPNLPRNNPAATQPVRPAAAAPEARAPIDSVANLRPVPEQRSERPVFASSNPYREQRPAGSVQPVVAPTAPVARPVASQAYIPQAPVASAPVAPPTSFFTPAAAAAPSVAGNATPSAVPELDFSDLDLLDAEVDLAPEVDTVLIEEPVVALADDFDIPELAIEEPVPARTAVDDFDTDFADAFSELSSPSPAQPAWRPAAEVRSAASAHQHGGDHHRDGTLDADFASFQQEMERDFGEFDTSSYDGHQMEFDVPADEMEASHDKGRRLPLFGAIFGGLALLVAGGVYAYSSFGEMGDTVPALVRADDGPVKVKPEVTGGDSAPAQESKVYKQVAGSGQASKPTQTTLVSEVEEPIVPMPRSGAAELPGVEQAGLKSEDRLTPDQTAGSTTPSEAPAAIAPRKVRTMIVRADGTLVERDAPATAAIADPEPTSAVAIAEPVLLPETRPAAPAAAEVKPVAAEAKPAAPAAKTVKTTTIRPQEPAEAPVQVAAAQPAPATEMAGGASAAVQTGGLWSVQIASQPTRDGAQASYEALANRYGGVIGGKGVNIVQAEVSGKQMWRVRIPAASKNDANILCAKLKTAGGSCFVSR